MWGLKVKWRIRVRRYEKKIKRMEDKQGKEILEQKEDWKDQYGREKERNTAIKTAGKL